MERIPEAEVERLKREVSASGFGSGGGAEAARNPPLGAVSVPRRQGAVAVDLAEEESVALPGGVPSGRVRDRLGDARP